MTSVGPVQASGGSFVITDAQGRQQTVDLGVLMMMVNIDRAENIDKQIADMIGEIQGRNDKIQLMTEFLSQCRYRKAEGLDDGSPKDVTYVDANGKPTGTSGHHARNLTINGETRSIQGPNGWAEVLGIPWTDVYGPSGNSKEAAEAAWDTNIQNVKSAIDMLNNDSQMANIRLQNLLEKRGNAYEMATKTMSTNNQSVQSVLRNL